MAIKLKINPTALPDKLGELLEVALRDLATIELDPEHFRVDMSRWVVPLVRRNESEIKHLKRCQVCLAGALMIRSLGVSSEMGDYCEISPSSITFGDVGEDQRLIWKLRALNEVRQGHVLNALALLSNFVMPLELPVLIDSHPALHKLMQDLTAEFGCNPGPHQLDVLVPAYDEDKDLWHRTMRRIAEGLKEQRL